MAKNEKNDDQGISGALKTEAYDTEAGAEAPGVTRGGRLVSKPAPERELKKGDAKSASVKAEDSGDNDPNVVVQDDVYEEFYYEGTTRPAYRLLFTKGQVVRQSQLDAVKSETK